MGTANSGLGHVVRDLALARRLAGTFDVNFTVSAESPGAEMVRDAGLRLHVGGFAEAVRSLRPSAIVYDRPPSEGAVPDPGVDSHVPIIALDYFRYFDEHVDAIINVRSHGYQGTSSADHYEGIRYALVRPEVLVWRERAMAPVTPAEQVLVTFGGADPSGHVHRVLDQIEAVGTSATITVVIGRAFSGVAPVERDGITVRVLHDVENMGELIAQADLVFCGAGVTLAETLTLGRPACVVPQNPDEMNLARDLAGDGACLLLDPAEWVSARQTIEAALSNEELRDRLSRKGPEVCDGAGVDRVSAIVERYAKEPR